MAQLNTKIVLRNDSTENWTNNKDKVLLKGEVGVEFLPNGATKVKIGDSTTTWENLPYFEGATYKGDDKTVVMSPEGTISLKGVTEAATGAYPSKKADGSIEWVKPDNSTVEGLNQTVETLVTRTDALETTVGSDGSGLVKDVNDVKTNLTTNYYNKEEVDQKVVGAFHFKGEANKFEGGQIYVDESTSLTGMEEGDVYQVNDKEYAYNGIEWVELGFNIDLSHLAEKTLVTSTAEQTLEDAKAYADTKVAGIDLQPYAKTTEVDQKIATAKEETITDAVAQAKTYTDSAVEPLTEQMAQKVDKVPGKVLSSNDFTNALKDKLDKIPENTADLIESLQTEMSPLKVLNVKLNYTIPTEEYQNVAEPTLKKKFYADVPCTKSKLTMNCQISPADEVEDVSLLTYAEPLDGSVRCYFMDKPVAPYIIESIEFTNVIQSEELQTQTVYEQEMATYAIWKEQHDKEVAQAQQAIAEEKAREEAQKEQRLATMEYNIRNVEQASAGTAETVSLMQPKVRFMALDKVDSIVSDYASGGEPMPIDIMDIAEPEEWQPNATYKKGDLFVYEGKGGFAKQDVSSLDIYKPFTTGTESLYGARPKAVNGVYPYVYNMAVEIGMIVEHNGVKYRAIQNANELLYEPSAVPAILEVIEDAD